MGRIKDKPLLIFSLVGLLSNLFLPLVEIKPNRISNGIQMSAFEFIGLSQLIITGFWVILVFLSLYSHGKKSLFVFYIGAVSIVMQILLMGIKGNEIVSGNLSIRVTFASSFYIGLLMLYLTMSESFDSLKERKMLGILGIGIILLGLFFAFRGGLFSSFSIIKEFEVKKDQFFVSLWTHAFLSFGSVLAGALIAIPLGYLSYRRKNLENVVMVPLSILETIPSLSLFAILLVPLANLGKNSFFNSIGVSGIGWAPAFVALTLYTLLPIGRNTLVGFSSVDKNVIEAAKGMGMNSKEILLKIEFPLSFPLILTGIRIALVQTIGGAVLAGLVGGGGLGSFVFLGLAEASPDLILLGVIPIVAITLLMDGSLKAVYKTLRRKVE
ncbi:MAG: ABC transporter permease [Clostridiaceae bacterium]